MDNAHRIFVIAGIVLWIVVGLYLWDIHDLMVHGVRVRGEVVDLEMRKAKGSTKKSYHPVVVFETDDGREGRLVGDVGSHPPAYEIGERVDVLYDPADLEEAYLDSFMGLYFFPLLLGSLGTVSLVAGLGMWIRGRGRRGP